MSGLVGKFGRTLGIGVWAVVVLGTVASVPAQEKGIKPLGEEDLVKLIELQVGDEAVVGRIEKGGVGFAVDEAALDRLRAAGASDAVLGAVREAAAKSKPPAEAITYEDVRKLLELGIGEGSILARLEKSPTRFVLDTKQREELGRLGASPRLIAAMEGNRDGQRNPEINDFVLILDCSGSMQEATPDGSPKMEAAKKAVADLIERIPEGRRLSFIVYGHDKAAACRAVKVVRPMAALDPAGRNELGRMIDTLRPVGSTPIALALKTAGGQLDAQVPATMVLVSDGMETCKGDPAGEAAALAEKFNLTFGVVGFDVKPEERKSLEAIAEAGKGKYYDARSAAELIKVTEEIAEVAPAADGAVTAPIEVWVEKNYKGTENPLHSEFSINGRLVDVFSSDTRKPISRFLKKGWNTVTIKTTPQVPANSENGLTFQVGPVAKDPNSGEPAMTTVLWRFRNDTDWKFDGGRYKHPSGRDITEATLEYRLYYAGLEHEAAETGTGDYVLGGTSDYQGTDVPVTATAFVNGTPLNSFTLGDRAVIVTRLLKPGRNEIKLVSNEVKGSFASNDIRISLGGRAEYDRRDDRWNVEPILQMRAMQGWTVEEGTGRLANQSAPGEDAIERTVAFVVDELPGGRVAAKIPAEDRPARPGSEPTDIETGDAEPVSDPIEVWVQRNYQSTENPLHSEFIVNGTTVDVFSSDTRKPLSKHLRKGWNLIEVKTTPQVPANGENGLIFRIGPVAKDPQTGRPVMTGVLWEFRNDTDWKFDAGRYKHSLGPGTEEVTLRYRLYYAGLEHENAKLKDGDYVVQGGSNYAGTNVPVTATMFVNGTPLNSFVVGQRQVRITPLLKQGKNEVRIVTHRVSDCLAENDITFDVGGPAKYNPREDKFLLDPVVEIKALQGWKQDEQTGQFVSLLDPETETIERSVTFVLDEAPK